MKSILDIFKKHKIVIAIAMCAILAFGIYDMANKNVELFADGKTMKVSTFAGDVKGLLEENGLKISKEDKVCPDLDEKLSDGMSVRVYRAFEVTINENGTSHNIKTTAQTVEQLLKQENIKLSEHDKVEPGISKQIKAGDQVSITRVDIQKVEVDEEIPYKVEVVTDGELEAGKSEVVQKGKKGIKKTTYEIVLENGIETQRSKSAEKIVSAPLEEVVKKGTKSFTVAMVATRGESREYKKMLSMVATAYTAGYESTGKNPGDPYYGITRSGTKVRPGVVAVDPRVIPLGTKLYIEPLGITAVAEDTGSAIKGNKIDIYMESVSDAKKFGKKNVTVYILK